MKRKRLYAVLAAAGTLALLLGGLSGVAVVSAQEETPEPEDGSNCAPWGWGRGLLGLGHGRDWTLFDTVAEELGLTPEELFSELHDGKSLEEIAEEQETDLEAIRQALEAARHEAIRDAVDRAVDEGKLSEDEAEWLLEGLEKGYLHGRGFGRDFMRRGRGRGPRMRGNFGPFAPDRFEQQSDSSDARAPALLDASSL